MPNQQMVTYMLEMHKQDHQKGHPCPIKKWSHTSYKCTNKAKLSGRSSMPNQKMVTYTLEMHKQGKIIREVIHAQSTNGHIQTGNAQTR